MQASVKDVQIRFFNRIETLNKCAVTIQEVDDEQGQCLYCLPVALVNISLAIGAQYRDIRYVTCI